MISSLVSNDLAFVQLVNETGLRSLNSSVSMRARLSREPAMAGLFDVSKEIILVTGASQGLGRQFARVLSGSAQSAAR